MADKAKMPMERRSPAAFVRSIFGNVRFSKKKTKPLPTMTKKVSIKNIKRPPKHGKPPQVKVYQNPLSKPRFPFSKPIKVKRDPIFASSELSLALSKASPSGTFYRGTGNVKLVSNLGNLKPRSHCATTLNNEAIVTPKIVSPKIVVKTRSSHVTPLNNETTVTPKIISPKIVVKQPTKVSAPERLKIEGNEKHKMGKFDEALALYNQAINLDPKRASYYSNKSAALIGLGRLVEAAFACKEAVQIEPSYERAHHRLATLYFRLGKAEKALQHYKKSGPKADSKDISKTQVLKEHLIKCKNAKEINDWNLIAKESQAAISSGADSAPQIYAMLVEALLKLHKHQEAYDKYQQGPHFNIDSCGRLFGTEPCAYMLTVQAQVYLAAGRFEDALTNCHKVAQYSSSDEVNVLTKRVHAVVLARSNGNKLFKVCKFEEASVAYCEGLDHDPHNATLLCNRAACELKLGHFREAVGDCNKALRLRPTYSKARLRRAECYVKLENWDAAIQDYEKLIKETPEDEMLNQAMLEAILQLRNKQNNLETKDSKLGNNIVSISSNEQFEHLATLPGISVVLFYKKKNLKQVLGLIQQACKGFPSFNFLKVDVENHPLLAKSEGAISVPRFMIYKDGLKVQEIPGKDHELLERSLKSYSC